MLRVMREVPISGGYNLIDLLVCMIHDICYINTPSLLGSSVVWDSTGNERERRLSCVLHAELRRDRASQTCGGQDELSNVR